MATPAETGSARYYIEATANMPNTSLDGQRTILWWGDSTAEAEAELDRIKSNPKFSDLQIKDRNSD